MKLLGGKHTKKHTPNKPRAFQATPTGRPGVRSAMIEPSKWPCDRISHVDLTHSRPSEWPWAGICRHRAEGQQDHGLRAHRSASEQKTTLTCRGSPSLTFPPFFEHWGLGPEHWHEAGRFSDASLIPASSFMVLLGLLLISSRMNHKS